MEDNLFIDLAESYFGYINYTMRFSPNCKGLTTKRFLFKKDTVHLYYKNKINDIINELYILLKVNKISFIYQFAKYIRYAEKCFMYKNDESSIVYSEDIKENTNIYFNFKDYKIKITFEKSQVPALDDSLFCDIDNENKYILFVKMEIAREFGKKMKNEFKFISKPEQNFSDNADRILYNNIINKCIREIESTNNQILNSIVPFYTGIIDDYYKDELLDWRIIKDHGLQPISR